MRCSMQDVEELVLPSTNGLHKLPLQVLHNHMRRTFVHAKICTHIISNGLVPKTAPTGNTIPFLVSNLLSNQSFYRISRSATTIKILQRIFSGYGTEFLANLPGTKDSYNWIMTVTECHTVVISCHMRWWAFCNLSCRAVFQVYCMHVWC